MKHSEDKEFLVGQALKAQTQLQLKKSRVSVFSSVVCVWLCFLTFLHF